MSALQPRDRAFMARVLDAPAAGDVVVLNPPGKPGNRDEYAIGCVYLEAKGDRPYLLLRVNEGRSAPVGLIWFESVGRCNAEDVTIVDRGRFAARVECWKTHYPW